jgi:hypothetical protein
MCATNPCWIRASLIRDVVYLPRCAKIEIVWNSGSMRTAPVK